MSNCYSLANSQLTPGKFYRPKAGDQTAVFDWSAAPKPIKLTKTERQREYERKYAAKRRLTAKERAAEILVQKPQNFHISPTPQADSDRTACITGKSNHRRSS